MKAYKNKKWAFKTRLYALHFGPDPIKVTQIETCLYLDANVSNIILCTNMHQISGYCSNTQHTNESSSFRGIADTVKNTRGNYSIVQWLVGTYDSCLKCYYCLYIIFKKQECEGL